LIKPWLIGGVDFGIIIALIKGMTKRIPLFSTTILLLLTLISIPAYSIDTNLSLSTASASLNINEAVNKNKLEKGPDSEFLDSEVRLETNTQTATLAEHANPLTIDQTHAVDVQLSNNQEIIKAEEPKILDSNIIIDNFGEEQEIISANNTAPFKIEQNVTVEAQLDSANTTPTIQGSVIEKAEIENNAVKVNEPDFVIEKVEFEK